MNLDTDKEEATWYKSKASCKVDDIKSIIVGAQSTRFWPMRKHMNLIIPKDYLNNPS